MRKFLYSYKDIIIKKKHWVFRVSQKVQTLQSFLQYESKLNHCFIKYTRIHLFNISCVIATKVSLKEIVIWDSSSLEANDFLVRLSLTSSEFCKCSCVLQILFELVVVASYLGMHCLS